MRRAPIFLIVIILGSLALVPAASAQDDGPQLELSGDDITVTEDGDETTYTVAAPGSYDITVTGSGFSLDVFVLQCPGAGGSLDALEEGDPSTLCDLGNLISASPDGDGAFEVMFEGVEVDGCGLVFAAGDVAQVEAAAVLLDVEEPGDAADCEVVENTGYATDDAEVLGTSEEAALATTGLETSRLVVLALILGIAGGLILWQSRRLAAGQSG